MAELKRIRIEIEPCHYPDGYSEMRVSAWVNGEVVTRSEALLNDDMQSLYDYVLDRARTALKEAIVGAGAGACR